MNAARIQTCCLPPPNLQRSYSAPMAHIHVLPSFGIRAFACLCAVVGRLGLGVGCRIGRFWWPWQPVDSVNWVASNSACLGYSCISWELLMPRCQKALEQFQISTCTIPALGGGRPEFAACSVHWWRASGYHYSPERATYSPEYRVITRTQRFSRKPSAQVNVA